MHAAPEKAYTLVYDYEEQFAYRLGRDVLQKPEVSVWMIVIPILFVHHMYLIKRYKTGVRFFAQGIMKTRKKALDKAFEEISEQAEQIMLPAEAYYPDLDTLLDYDPTLLEKEVRVINIFKKHYWKLLQSKGDTYQDLLRAAYPDARRYREFIQELNQGERELNRYLADNVHDSAEGRQIVQRMQECSIQLRKEELRFFYGQGEKKKR